MGIEFKKHGVERLPAMKARMVHRHRGHNYLLFKPEGLYVKTSAYQPFHLYVISDEEPKVDDWVIYYGQVKQIGEIYPYEDSKNLIFVNDLNEGVIYSAKKIVASTDPNLNDPNCSSCGNVGCHLCMTAHLPTLPDNFLELYCKSNGIGHIAVEFTDGEITINKDNCIIINGKNRTFTHEEVEIELLRLAVMMKTHHLGNNPDDFDIKKYIFERI